MFIVMLVLLSVVLANYALALLSTPVQTPVPWESDHGIGYWANRARYYETGSYAGWERSARGAVRPCALSHDVTGCTSDCDWVCAHLSGRLNAR